MIVAAFSFRMFAIYTWPDPYFQQPPGCWNFCSVDVGCCLCRLRHFTLCVCVRDITSSRCMLTPYRGYMFRAFLIKLEDEDFQLFLPIMGKMRPFQWNEDLMRTKCGTYNIKMRTFKTKLCRKWILTVFTRHLATSPPSHWVTVKNLHRFLPRFLF